MQARAFGHAKKALGPSLYRFKLSYKLFWGLPALPDEYICHSGMFGEFHIQTSESESQTSPNLTTSSNLASKNSLSTSSNFKLELPNTMEKEFESEYLLESDEETSFLPRRKTSLHSKFTLLLCTLLTISILTNILQGIYITKHPSQTQPRSKIGKSPHPPSSPQLNTQLNIPSWPNRQ